MQIQLKSNDLVPATTKKDSSSLSENKSDENKVDSPLDPLSSRTTLRSVNNQDFNDPLSPRLKETILDPLSALSLIASPVATSPSTSISPMSTLPSGKGPKSNGKEVQKTPQKVKIDYDDPWLLKKQDILKNYVYKGDITLSSSAINDFQGSGVEDGSEQRFLDLYTQRLAALEKRNVTDDKVKLTQMEYESNVKRLSADLDKAWKADDRVGSLKLAIQIAKLLGDSSVPQFYPTIFVMISNELDRFGKMVFQRLRNKAEETVIEQNGKNATGAVFPEDFKSDQVPALAREICRNWFYKIACVREVVPRIFIEMSLIRCYKFMPDVDYAQVLTRLVSMMRGIGDPLVSLYARLYLSVVGRDVCPTEEFNTCRKTLLHDVIFSFKHYRQSGLMDKLSEKYKMTPSEYYRLMCPALDWLIEGVGKNASKEVFQEVLAQYRDHCGDSLVLRYIIDHFSIYLYSHAMAGMISLIKAATLTHFAQVELYTALGKQMLVFFPVSDPQQKLSMLNEIWRIVSKTEDLNQYIRCCAVWIEVIQRYYSQREVTVLLTDLTSKLEALTNETLPESIQKQVEGMLISLLQDTEAGLSSLLFASESLVKILDRFVLTRKVSVCKEIMGAFRHHPATNDAVLINTLFSLCRILHDSVDTLSPDSERQQVAALLTVFIRKVDFGRDLEQQLNIFTECRALFCNLDAIKDTLVMSVCELGMKVIKLTKGKLSKKTSSFAKSCLAFCFITIPSIKDIFRKLDLLLLCAQVALTVQCLPQSDAFLKAAVALLPEVPMLDDRVSTENRIMTFLYQFMSFLVVVPGHPENGPFHILKLLLLAIPEYPWQANTGNQARVYVCLINLLCALAQPKLPYHACQVESNDALYTGSEVYSRELGELLAQCIDKAIRLITGLGDKADIQAQLNQARTCLDLANSVACRFGMNVETVGGSTCACEFGISMKSAPDELLRLMNAAAHYKPVHTAQDSKYYQNTVELVRSLLKENKSESISQRLASWEP